MPVSGRPRCRLDGRVTAPSGTRESALPLGIPSDTRHWLGLVVAGWPAPQAPEAPLDCGDDGEMLADPGMAARRPFRRCAPPGQGEREPAGTGSEQNPGQQRISLPAPPG